MTTGPARLLVVILTIVALVVLFRLGA